MSYPGAIVAPPNEGGVVGEVAGRSAAFATSQPLAQRQAALVAALTEGAPIPAGFDDRLVGIARTALLRKRAGEVARHWPMLAAAAGPDWTAEFTRWAATRPTQGSLRDGWDMARAKGALPRAAAEELAVREATWHHGRMRPRRGPAVGRAYGVVVLQIFGRVCFLTRS